MFGRKTYPKTHHIGEGKNKIDMNINYTASYTDTFLTRNNDDKRTGLNHFHLKYTIECKNKTVQYL